MEGRNEASAPGKPEEKKEDRKKLIIQAIVVLVCLGFILESFAFGSRGGGTGAGGTAEAGVYVGVADANMTVLDYRPYLYADRLLNESEKREVMALDGVEEIMDDATRSVISVSDSSKTHEAYSELRRKNITTYTLATLAMPGYFEMVLGNGSKANVMGTRFDYMMEPVSAIGGKILMRLVIQAKGEAPTGISSITPILSVREMDYDAEILDAAGKTYYYTVPWEGRGLDVGALEEEFGAENVEYARDDSVILPAMLSPQEMLSKKFDYVETISERAITVRQGFTDRERVEQDFGEGLAFMNSTLAIRSEADPGLNFTHEVRYIYTIRIPERIERYDFYSGTAEVVASGERSGTIPVTISAEALGDTVMGISGVREREG